MTNKNFRLAQPVKRAMAFILDPHKCGEYKRLMIAAQVSYEENKRRPFKEDKEETVTE